jgi:hypothetical protein
MQTIGCQQILNRVHKIYGNDDAISGRCPDTDEVGETGEVRARV